PVVLGRAEERGVPILLVNMDTLSTVEAVERFFARSRFQQPEKLERFAALLDEYFDFAALYASLGLKVGV
ncbi:MAG: hypothetical protein JW850_09600, partial [Thermoflexales bacterium]|nr:hypothetical protein [Thermoflexales bacterium]